ncbi:hypothetical protein BDA96_10G026100 [Sorghum bicolor]|uniref:Uncharacterized protein n=1 Tax=Sorghum bicolor TaxID=4558 RepID=A0A921TZI3_SORBI|nr:hypothetical protein BDA96_10G026100 [Sorghum bicolor]
MARKEGSRGLQKNLEECRCRHAAASIMVGCKLAKC